ncbi:MAG: 1-deoxy-D-xylulose-5-phosphate synthase [Bacteroidetes bacterium HGW-Bacteroidetes-21]|jgi:1-deoxy-D-xylulose-5-phosphate synthase|nr:MAG: 1-deoxy-D-xylulose-5-phosphate synthase [Bacteroidetes bacterium HGW-Bacteroidetes-21]
MPLVNSKYLDNINSPEDLKKLKELELIDLCKEIRQFIIDIVSCTPGHFAASLGVVELTVALHYALNTPYDKIIWDVGHQAYVHKILTGRKDQLKTIRQFGGISGYPTPSESEYDAFGVGHSSTSISAALGMAVADHLDKNKRQVVAVIGDGSMTAGQAFEGMNNAGIQKTNLLVILNDNNIAIDQSVGAFKEYLTDIATSRTYNKAKDEVWRILGKVKWGHDARHIIQKIDNGIKSVILRQSNLFEALGFRYFGPVDGHDVIYLSKIIEDLKKIPGPKLLHVKTVKGKGFSIAESHPTTYHAPGKFNKTTGEIIEEENLSSKPPLFQDVFGETLVELAEMNPQIVAVTPAMATGCSMTFMMEKFPKRTFDVGIAEQHAVTFSAGLAMQGKMPFCNIYSSFMQRSYDQVIHDVALQNLNVVLCLDRAGVVGNDGPTHHGTFDLAYFRCIPNLTISSPMNESELRNLMYTAQKGKGPFIIRYPKGRGVLTDWKTPFEETPVGKGRKLSDGNDVAILSIGPLGNMIQRVVSKAKEQGINIAHYDMRFLKPLDEELLKDAIKSSHILFSVEDGTISGGLGSAIAEYLTSNDFPNKLVRIGFPDEFIEHGNIIQLYHKFNITIDSILNQIHTHLPKK